MNPNETPESIVRAALEQARLNINLVKYIANTPSKEDKFGPKLIHIAAKCDRELFKKTLDTFGFKLDERDKQLQTPLHYAVRYNRPDVVEYILGQNPSLVDAQDFYQQTALHIAAKNKDNRMVELLIDSGAKIYIEDYFGSTPGDYYSYVTKYYDEKGFFRVSNNYLNHQSIKH